MPLNTTSTSSTDEMILAFRTITTLLSVFQHAPLTTFNMSVVDSPESGSSRRELRILTALATLLVRHHEITAVVSKANRDHEVGFIACATLPDQPDEKPESGVPLHGPATSSMYSIDTVDTPSSQSAGAELIIPNQPEENANSPVLGMFIASTLRKLLSYSMERSRAPQYQYLVLDYNKPTP
jgi:hypothetical protein